MRLAIKTIVAAAAITATATAVQPDANAAFPAFPLQPVATAVQRDADAAFPAFPLQPVAFTYLQQLGSDDYVLPAAMYGYSPQAMAYGYSPVRQFRSDGDVLPVAYGDTPLLKSYLDPSQVVFFDGADASNPSTEPPQRVSLAQPEEPVAPAPARGLQRVSLGQPEELVSPAPERHLDLAPERRTSLEPSGHTDLPPARQLMSPIVRIQFNAPTLAPMAHTFFCLKYPDDCKIHKIVFRRGAVRLTAKRWAELVRVNAAVNRAITPQPNTEGLAGEKWLISPKSGECHDYAVTKRHELLALGWPERDLLLSEVVTSWGEHHLVLVIRTSDGDFVADNLNPNIRSWSKAPYQWVRIQSPDNPTFWSTVASTTVWAKSSGLANPEP